MLSFREWWQWRGTPHSPKLQDWSFTIRSFCGISGTLISSRAGRAHSSAEMQSVYFTAPADWSTSEQFRILNTPPFWGERITFHRWFELSNGSNLFGVSGLIYTLTKRLEKILGGNYVRMLRAVWNKLSWQHPTKLQINSDIVCIS